MHLKQVLACIIFCIAVNRIHAQCSTAQPTLTVSSDPCTGSIITFGTNILPSTVSWYRGNTLLANKTPQPPSDAVTVAGGNGAGSAASQLSSPYRIFVASDGTIYIPDYDNHRVQKWLPGATAGITVAGGHGAGNAANQLSHPTAVFVDQYNSVYVADKENYRIQKWTPGSTAGVTVATFSAPADVFVDKQGNIYTSAQASSQVQMVTISTNTYTVAAGSGDPGNSLRDLASNTGIFVDDNGAVYVCDSDNNRIMKWTRGATTGILVAGGSSGSGNNQLNSPSDVVVDCMGNLYIADRGNNRIQKWAPGASEGITVAGGNGQGAGINQLNQPVGLSVDSTGTIYVADFNNHRIQKFSNTIENTYLAGIAGKYTVRATFSCCTLQSDTILISDPSDPTVTVKADTTVVCGGRGTIVYTAKPVHGGNTPVYRWFKNDLATTITTSIYTDNGAAGGDRVYCMLTSSDRCVNTPIALSNVVNITSSASVPLNLGADQAICPGAAITISAPSGFHDLVWQDGSGAAGITVTAPGKYYLQAKDACNITYSDTVLIKEHVVASGFLPADTAVCTYDKLELKSRADFAAYLWSTRSTAASITVNAGTFWLRGTDKNNCVTSDTIVITSGPCPAKGFYVPTAFSPDGNGKNDTFKPTFYGTVSNYQFSIYNRYGQQVFSSATPNEGWNGTTKGKYFDMTVFVWSCRYSLDGGPLQQKQGTVTLLR